MIWWFEGVSIPRQASKTVVLPSARDVSLAVHKDVDKPHDHLTTMAAMWGQLIHHDISHTPQMAGELIQPCPTQETRVSSLPVQMG